MEIGCLHINNIDNYQLFLHSHKLAESMGKEVDFINLKKSNTVFNIQVIQGKLIYNNNNLKKDKYNKDKALLMGDCENKKTNIYKILFYSGRYNFSPDYISSLNGKVRPSDKRMYEGEKKKTIQVLVLHSLFII